MRPIVKLGGRLGVSLALCMLLTTTAFAGSFAAIYGGTGDDSDAETFRTEMKDIGWSELFWATTEDESGGHTGLVKASDVLYEADKADILYYSSHGFNDDGIYYVTIHGAEPDHIYPNEDQAVDDGYTGYYNYIGDAWTKYSSEDGYYTDSKWDNDLIWVVWAACNQIEDTIWDEDGAAKYGRTLCGYPHRLHQIMGYHDAAPGDTIDWKVAQKFVQKADAGYYVKYAWEVANETYDRDQWSVVYHYANRHDKLNAPTTDTSYMDPPSIWFDYTGFARQIPVVGAIPRMWEGIAATLYQWLASPRAEAAGRPQTLQTYLIGPSEVPDTVIQSRSTAEVWATYVCTSPTLSRWRLTAKVPSPTTTSPASLSGLRDSARKWRGT